jgi:hypothetical protein
MAAPFAGAAIRGRERSLKGLLHNKIGLSLQPQKIHTKELPNEKLKHSTVCVAFSNTSTVAALDDRVVEKCDVQRAGRLSHQLFFRRPQILAMVSICPNPLQRLNPRSEHLGCQARSGRRRRSKLLGFLLLLRLSLRSRLAPFLGFACFPSVAGRIRILLFHSLSPLDSSSFVRTLLSDFATQHCSRTCCIEQWLWRLAFEPVLCRRHAAWLPGMVIIA